MPPQSDVGPSQKKLLSWIFVNQCLRAVVKETSLLLNHGLARPPGTGYYSPTVPLEQGTMAIHVSTTNANALQSAQETYCSPGSWFVIQWVVLDNTKCHKAEQEANNHVWKYYAKIINHNVSRQFVELVGKVKVCVNENPGIIQIAKNLYGRISSALSQYTHFQEFSRKT